MARSKDEGLLDRILDAAFETFGRNGFQGTTLKQIATGADISTGSIYNYFPDKETLFSATVTRGWDDFIAGLERINAEVPGRAERIRALVDQGLGTIGPAIHLIRGMLFEASRLNLLVPKIDQLCRTIESLIRPDSGDPEEADWGLGEARRFLLIRICVLGILTSAALVDPPSPETAIQGLREAIGAFLGDHGLPRPDAILLQKAGA